jgi:hypothetical protein
VELTSIALQNTVPRFEAEVETVSEVFDLDTPRIVMIGIALSTKLTPRTFTRGVEEQGVRTEFTTEDEAQASTQGLEQFRQNEGMELQKRLVQTEPPHATLTVELLGVSKLVTNTSVAVIFEQV